MTTECAKETIAQLTLEIRNLAHHGWEDRPNAEFLFREIGQRAQKISALGGAAQEGDCPCGATVVRKSDSANKSKLCADCAAQEEAPREEWRAGMKEAAQIADHFANDELSVVEWPEYGLMARDRRCDSGMTGVMGERIAAAIRAKLTSVVVAEEEAGAPTRCPRCYSPHRIRRWCPKRVMGTEQHKDHNEDCTACTHPWHDSEAAEPQEPK